MTYPEITDAMRQVAYPNDALREIILFWRDLEAKLTALGPAWSLARFQCYRELSQFEQYASARGWELNTLRAPRV